MLSSSLNFFNHDMRDNVRYFPDSPFMKDLLPNCWEGSQPSSDRPFCYSLSHRVTFPKTGPLLRTACNRWPIKMRLERLDSLSPTPDNSVKSIKPNGVSPGWHLTLLQLDFSHYPAWFSSPAFHKCWPPRALLNRHSAN